MKSELGKLQDLQDCDLVIFRLKRRLAEIPEETRRLEEHTRKEEQDLQCFINELKHAEVLQKEEELEVSSRETELKKLRSRLLEVKTNREYTALNNEMATLKEEIASREEDVLLLMEQVNENRKKRTAQEEKAAQEHIATNRQIQEMQKEAEQLSAELQREEQRRSVFTNAVSGKTMAVYEQVLAKKPHGLALAKVLAHNCGGCQMRIPTITMDNLYKGNNLVLCEHCGRILCLAE